MTRNLVYSGWISIALMTSAVTTKSFAQVTPEHIAQLKAVAHSAYSGNGNHIAYTLTDPADPKKCTCIFSMSLPMKV
jgi:hypothetical protein